MPNAATGSVERALELRAKAESGPWIHLPEGEIKRDYRGWVRAATEFYTTVEAMTPTQYAEFKQRLYLRRVLGWIDNSAYVLQGAGATGSKPKSATELVKLLREGTLEQFLTDARESTV